MKEQLYLAYTRGGLVGIFLKITSVKYFPVQIRLNNYVQDSSDLLLRSSDLYKKFLETRANILENKWYMSEKEGHDVGFDRALVNYFTYHHQANKK